MSRYLAFFLERRLLLLLIVLGAGFVIVPNPTWAMIFYLAILPGAGARLLAGHDWPDELGAWVGVALIGWFSLTILWDANPGPHAVWLWNGACTLAFFVTAIATLREDEAAREKLISVLCVGGLLNAVLSILVNLHAPAERMTGWAETRHPILGASIIGVSVVLAMGRMLAGRAVALSGATVIVGVVFIVLTGSRGPLIAIVGSLAVLLIALRPRACAVLGAAGAVTLGAVSAVSPATLPAIIARAMERGWSNRIDIWRISLGKIAQHPLIGSGPATLLGRPTEDFPHNLFLSTLLYSGIVGLVLLVALLGLAARAAWSETDRTLRWTLLALVLHVILSGLTDLSQLTKGPSPMWYIVWLPIILALTSHRTLTRHKRILC